MKATGTDGKIAPESVDTKFDTNRDDKGLLQAMNGYNMKIMKPDEIQGVKIKEPLTPQGHKGLLVYGAGEPAHIIGTTRVVIRWRLSVGKIARFA